MANIINNINVGGVNYDIQDDRLSSQTAYSAKGSATKVPQITTNAMGQVTGITEVAITQPTVNDGKLTVKVAGTEVGNFTANQSSDTEVDVTLGGLGVSATAAELNVLDGITATTAELNYTDGVTSNIQTQLDAKVPNTRTVNGHALSANVTVSKSDVGLGSVVNTGDSATPVSGGTTKFTTGGAYTELAKKVDKNADITAGTACKITYDKKGLVTAGAALSASDIPDLTLDKITDVTATAAEVNILDGVTATTEELNYVDGVTSAIQGQLDALGTRIDNLPKSLIFKGSLGTGGTVTALPTASSATVGHVYKVITAGTYASIAAKVGDLFICSDKPEWVLIPSGDEPSGTVTSVGLSNNSQGTMTISGSPITSSGTINISLASAYGDTVNPYASKTKNYVLAAPSSANGVPSFRALAAADIPSLTLAKISDVTATAAEVNIMHGVTATTAELNYVDGVTSAIQTQLDGKQPKITGEDIESVEVTSTEINYLSGVTSNIQTQLNGKVAANSAITGATKCKITYDSKGLVTAGADLSASDIPSLTLSKISDVTATASEVNVLDGITATTTELNYVDGVTSAIQTQLNGKQATISDLATIRSGAAAGATALQPNTAITAATKCKITYDSKGLVTAGADLSASDIPSLAAGKITSGTFDVARIPSLTLSKISDVTATAAEVNILDGVTKSTSELNGAFNYKGTIGTSGTVTALPTSAGAGDAYKVITVGTYSSGLYGKVGDFYICTAASTTAPTWAILAGPSSVSGTTLIL